MKLIGIPASDGIALAKVFRYSKKILSIPEQTSRSSKEEWLFFQSALSSAQKQIEAIRADVKHSLDEEHAQIFDAHLQILNDPAILEETQAGIQRGLSAPRAYRNITDKYAKMFSEINDAYLKERSLDLKDVAERVIYALMGLEKPDLSQLSEDVVVFSHDLTPSDTAKLDREHIKGFVTEIGGRTSHSAIMAKSLGIPTVLGISGLLEMEGDEVIVDGKEGIVILSPTEQEVKSYQKILTQDKGYREQLKSFISAQGKTKDGKRVEIAANIGSPDDLYSTLQVGAEGIGLLRTEFLFMYVSNFPSEEKQYQAYKRVLSAYKDKKVVIRILDIGGDKKLGYFNMPYEMNPFLGNRGIRLCLNHYDILKTQLRALLKANIHGNLCVMLPMVSTLNELQESKKILKEVEGELDEVLPYQLGVMIEVPAAALLADAFAREVDFFSVGSNDLIQYSMAVDRMNSDVSHLYQPLHPSVLKLIKMAIDAAHREGRWIGICGEMAGVFESAIVLVGLGVDELSMNAPAILPMKKKLLNVDYQEVKALSERILNFNDETEVMAEINRYFHSKE